MEKTYHSLKDFELSYGKNARLVFITIEQPKLIRNIRV